MPERLIRTAYTTDMTDRPSTPNAFESDWQDHCAEQDRWTAVVGAAVGATMQPLWMGLDRVTQPERWMLYAPGRVVLAVACVALIVGMWRIQRGRDVRAALLGTFLFGGVAIGATVPAAGPSYPLYVLGYSLVLWAAGCVVGLSWGWSTALFVGLVVEFGAVHLALGTDQDARTLLGAAFYLITAAALCTGSSALRHRARREAFASAWALERRNQELADSRLEVVEERALGAAKNAFLARMSHELRTPLTAMLGYTELVKADLEDAGLPESVRDLDKVQDAGRHLLGLMTDILDLSAIEAGQVPFDPSDLDVAGLVHELADAVRPAASGKAIEVLVSGDPLVVRHDPTRLRQVIVALLSNAVRFTERGHVGLAVVPAGGRVRIEVSDTGPGIAAASIARIFESFEQGDGSTTRRHGGSGLGLAVARGLARRMGGDIDVRSDPGVGSTFVVDLPIGHPTAT